MTAIAEQLDMRRNTGSGCSDCRSRRARRLAPKGSAWSGSRTDPGRGWPATPKWPPGGLLSGSAVVDAETRSSDGHVAGGESTAGAPGLLHRPGMDRSARPSSQAVTSDGSRARAPPGKSNLVGQAALNQSWDRQTYLAAVDAEEINARDSHGGGPPGQSRPVPP